ncbi:MAG: zinc metallopeptidase [Firmicutes bacterium]|nr:zinc metallopeptidase [Bacillota bacterium]
MIGYYGSWTLIGISLLITLGAQFFVTTTYGKYKKVENKTKKTGFETAREILDKNGLNDIYVVETQGNLTDHYDPKRNTIRLSSDIFHGTSIAACAVAAHEVGHALQYKDGYTPIKIRNSIIPLVNFSSSAGYFAILISFITGLTDLLWIGIALEVIILLFQLLTLPVEFNASKRAKEQLGKEQILDNNEINGANTMLNAAAMTYVASVVTAILQIIRLVLIARDND